MAKHKHRWPAAVVMVKRYWRPTRDLRCDNLHMSISDSKQRKKDARGSVEMDAVGTSAGERVDVIAQEAPSCFVRVSLRFLRARRQSTNSSTRSHQRPSLAIRKADFLGSSDKVQGWLLLANQHPQIMRLGERACIFALKRGGEACCPLFLLAPPFPSPASP